MKPIIAHVNQHVIKHNAKHGTAHPCLTVKHPRLGTVYTHAVEGHATLIDSAYAGRRPLDCGARVWLEYKPDGFAFLSAPIDWPTLRSRLEHDRENPSEHSRAGGVAECFVKPAHAKDVQATIDALDRQSV